MYSIYKRRRKEAEGHKWEQGIKGERAWSKIAE